MNELEEDVSESDTVTFHDALSSEDDISELLLDDLECDWMRSGQLVNQRQQHEWSESCPIYYNPLKNSRRALKFLK